MLLPDEMNSLKYDIMKKWTKEESEELVRIVEHSWDWIWIGWEQVKLKLEIDYPNGRSKSAIRQKYNSILNCR